MSSQENWCPPSPTPPPVLGVDQSPSDFNVRGQPGTATRSMRLSQLAHAGWRPLLLTGLIRNLLTCRFQPQNISQRDLVRYVWRPGLDTGILIESIYRWRGTLAEKRPAILIKRNAFSNYRLGLGDSIGRNEDGDLTFTTAWVGSHTVFCLHGNGAAVELLALETQRQLTHYAPVLMPKLQLLNFTVLEVGAITEVEEAKEDFAIPITVGWAYTESWVLQQEVPRLSGLKLSTLLDTDQFV